MAKGVKTRNVDLFREALTEYASGRCSQSKAAKMAGMSRPTFRKYAICNHWLFSLCLKQRVGKRNTQEIHICVLPKCWSAHASHLRSFRLWTSAVDLFREALTEYANGRCSQSKAAKMAGMSRPTFRKYANMHFLGIPFPDTLFKAKEE